MIIWHPKESFYKLNDRHIEFVIRKKSKVLWPRLLSSVVRPQWIKVDFDRIQPEDESDIDDNSMDKEFDELVPNQQNSYRNFGQKDFGRRKKSMNKGFKGLSLCVHYLDISHKSSICLIISVEDFKKTYLFLYNLFQFVGFVYVFLIVTIRYIKDGSRKWLSIVLIIP